MIVPRVRGGRFSEKRAYRPIFYVQHMAVNEKQYSHYYKDVSKLEVVDVYRVLQLFNVWDPCLQHAIKKLLVAGDRGPKDASKDVQEAIASLNRWQEMRAEDSR